MALQFNKDKIKLEVQIHLTVFQQLVQTAYTEVQHYTSYVEVQHYRLYDSDSEQGRLLSGFYSPTATMIQISYIRLDSCSR